MNNLFVFGLGYSAVAAAKLLQSNGWPVAGTVRSPDKILSLNEDGLAALRFDDKPGVEMALNAATHILVSAPPGEAGDPALLTYKHVLQATPKLRWIGYLSTIGVYGNHDGAWVDEQTPVAPAAGRGAARMQAEKGWEDLARNLGIPLDIFRLSGIYGPRRSPLDGVRDGEARRIIKPGQVFNRIHVEDIARAVAAAAQQQRHGTSVRVFNVTDDEPAPPQDVILYAATLLGAPPPPEVPFDTAALSPMARSFYGDNKRVRNDKMKRELGVELRYPTYREGLTALAKRLR